jgi:hypothetical protein
MSDLMNSESFIIDLSPWSAVLGPIFAQALSPATPVMLHRALAEQASSTVEQAAAMAAMAPDEEAPWRALRTEDALFLALDDGFAFAQFDGPEMVSLRVETKDGRRWSVIFTARGLGSFGLADAGPDPDLKIALFDDEQLVFSHSYYPDGRDSDDRDLQGAIAESQEAMADASPEGAASDAGPGSGLGLRLGAGIGAAALGAGALLLRRSLRNKATAPSHPAPEPLQRPTVPSPPAAPPVPPSAPAPAPPVAVSSPSMPGWRLVGVVGPMKGKVFLVSGVAIAGRETTVDIPVEDFSVSRRHAEFRVTEQGLELRDLGSSNGTWVGTTRVESPVLLKDGDKVSLGECGFRVERTSADRFSGAPPALPDLPVKPPPIPNPAPRGIPPQSPPRLPVATLCPCCQAPLDPAVNFCGSCGATLAPLASRRWCGRCGALLPEGGRFCPECGTPA